MNNLASTLTYSWLGCLLIFTAVLVLLKTRYSEYATFYKRRRRLFLVAGLALSRSISYTSVTSVLMWYFTYYQGDLVIAAAFSNTYESFSSLFVIFMSHAADSFVGRFRTLLFSTIAYIGGMMLLWFFNPYDVKWLLVVILFLLALGTSGDYVLYDIIKDLVEKDEKPTGAEPKDLSGEDKLQRRVPCLGPSKPPWTDKELRVHADVIGRVVYTIGSISATLWVVQDSVGGTHASWSTSFLTCIIAMTAGLIIFCTGHNRYRLDHKPIERPIEIFFRVFRPRIQKRFNSNSNRRHPTNTSREKVSTNDLDTQDGKHDKFRTPRLEEGGQDKEKEDMELVKRLLRMFPMWGLFFVVSLISASGSTFFIEQYSNLNTAKNLPIQIYDMIQVVSGFAIRCVYRWICGTHKNEKVKIGVGMLCGIICCIFAWQLEVHRLRGVHHLIDEEENTSISFLWLMPQFCVLGLMEELTWDGLLKFYELQFPKEPFINFGEQYIEVVQCFGKLFNIFLILIFKRVGWFGYTINESRVDKYYILLVCLCSANLIIYFCTVKCFYNNEPPQASGDADLHQASQPSNKEQSLQELIVVI